MTGFWCLSVKIRNSSKRHSWWEATKNCKYTYFSPPHKRRNVREKDIKTKENDHVFEASSQSGGRKVETGKKATGRFCANNACTMARWICRSVLMPEYSILHIKESEFQSISIVMAAHTGLSVGFLLCLGPEFPLQTMLWLGWSAVKWALFWCTMMHGRPWKPTRYTEVSPPQAQLDLISLYWTCFLLFPASSITDNDE